QIDDVRTEFAWTALPNIHGCSQMSVNKPIIRINNIEHAIVVIVDNMNLMRITELWSRCPLMSAGASLILSIRDEPGHGQVQRIILAKRGGAVFNCSRRFSC